MIILFTKGEVISHDQDLDYCIHLKQPVNVWQQGELIDYGGLIDKYTDESVVINGAFFMRSSCEFRIR